MEPLDGRRRRARLDAGSGRHGFDQALPRPARRSSHQEHGDPLPQMTWFSNYSKFGAATMFALFFGGNDFAPKTKIDGVPVQEYLQSHYIESIKRVAERVHDLPNVVGYDSLNEPVARWIGYPDLGAPLENDFARVGVTLTPFEAMQAAAGHSLSAPVYEMGGFQPVEQVTVNPDHLNLWRDGYADVWQQNGVWTNEGGAARLLRPHHFSDVERARRLISRATISSRSSLALPAKFARFTPTRWSSSKPSRAATR